MSQVDYHPVIQELHQLIRFKQGEKAIKLLRSPTNSSIPINQAINDETALHIAAKNDSHEVIEAILQNFKGSVNVNCKDFSGSTPLHYACGRGCVKTVNALLRHGANVNAQCDRQKQSPAHYAAESGSLATLMSLKRNQAKLDLQNIFGNTPLHRAAYHNHHHIIQFLLEEGKVDPDAKNNDDQTPLYMAIVYGDLESVSTLVSKFNASIEARVSSNYDKTLLQIAIQEKKDIIIQYLINKGADVNCADSRGITPIHEAVMENNFELFMLLLENGADVNVVSNIDLQTPLHHAAANTNIPIIKELLDAGANVNAQNQEDKTPLHIASEKGNAEIVRLLLENKAKRFIRDCYGRIPLDLAKDKEVTAALNEKLRWPSHLKVKIPTVGVRILNDATPKKELNLFPDRFTMRKAASTSSLPTIKQTFSSSPLTSFGGKSNNVKRSGLTNGAVNGTMRDITNESQSDEEYETGYELTCNKERRHSESSASDMKSSKDTKKSGESRSILATAFSENPAKDRLKSVAGKIASRKHAEKVSTTLESFEKMLEEEQQRHPDIEMSYYKDYIANLKREAKKREAEEKENATTKSKRWDPNFAYERSLSPRNEAKTQTKVIRIR